MFAGEANTSACHGCQNQQSDAPNLQGRSVWSPGQRSKVAACTCMEGTPHVTLPCSELSQQTKLSSEIYCILVLALAFIENNIFLQGLFNTLVEEANVKDK